MGEIPIVPSVPVGSPQGRRHNLVPTLIAFLAIPAAIGLGMVIWDVVRNADDAVVPETVDRTASGIPGTNGAQAPSASLQEILALRDLVPTHRHPLLGQKAPEFELADHEGNIWTLNELLADGPLVLIFYYGYHCIHCARQLHDMNRDLSLFHEMGASVVAISADSQELTRERFREYGPFSFTVLADPGHKNALAYRSFRWAPDGKMPDMLRHGTFLIDREGVVRWLNVSDAPFARNAALLYQLAKIEGAGGPDR